MTAKEKAEHARQSRQVLALVKINEGRSYAETLREVRSTKIDFAFLGTRVTSMRKTGSSDLLVELTKGQKSEKASEVIRTELATIIPDTTVTRLRSTATFEIECV